MPIRIGDTTHDALDRGEGRPVGQRRITQIVVPNGDGDEVVGWHHQGVRGISWPVLLVARLIDDNLHVHLHMACLLCCVCRLCYQLTAKSGEKGEADACVECDKKQDAKEESYANICQ